MSTSLLEIWSKRIEDQKSSGMSAKVWCIHNKLALHKYYYWKKRVSEGSVSSTSPVFVAITKTKLPEQKSLGLQVSLGNIQLTVTSVDDARLAATLLSQLVHTC